MNGREKNESRSGAEQARRNEKQRQNAKPGVQRGGGEKHKARYKHHIRGFGFAESLDGEKTWFCPPAVCRGLMDQDLIEVTTYDGDTAGKTRVIQRVRERVVGEVKDGVLVVDAGVGQGVVVKPTENRGAEDLKRNEGLSVWWSLTTNRVIEALGERTGERAIEVRMYERHMIDMGRSKEAEEEARLIAEKSQISPNNGRRDMCDAVVITIDAAESQDLDDALSARVMSDGSVRVWVHIADVSEYVTPGSALDDDAQKCPTSVYTPQRVRHMLPEKVAGNTLSLIPGVERDTLCCEMGIDQEGNIRSVDVYEARVQSRARVEYVHVGGILSGKVPHADEEINELVRTLHTAAARLSIQRAGRGGVDAWRADEDDHEESEGWAHNLIERLMVAANESVSNWLEQRGETVLYRAHPGFTEEEAAELDEKCQEMGLVTAMCSRITPKAFAAMAHAAKKAGREMMFWDAALSVMPRARYQTEQMGHFGLGSTSYCHFTSPLRRYADLLVHRAVKAYLAGERGIDGATMRDIAAHINETNRRADACERDSKRAVALRDVQKGEVRGGLIIGRQKKVWRVQTEGGVIGTMPVQAGEENRIGEHVTVKVTRVEALNGVMDLREVTQG